MGVGILSKPARESQDLRPSTRRAIEELDLLIEQVKTSYARVEPKLDRLLAVNEETDDDDRS